MAFGWIGSTAVVRRSREEAVDKMWAGDWLGAPITPEFDPDTREGCQRPTMLSANQTTSLFLVSGFGSGVYSAKLLNGTRHQFSGFSRPRQCGEEVFRMLVTGGPPNLGDGGIPALIFVEIAGYLP
jgi:hypothetical protein